MTVCGVVAEYNPFHAGHAHPIAETRRALGAETAVVCAMTPVRDVNDVWG